jgi:hypothetical protein
MAKGISHPTRGYLLPSPHYIREDRRLYENELKPGRTLRIVRTLSRSFSNATYLVYALVRTLPRTLESGAPGPRLLMRGIPTQ